MRMGAERIVKCLISMHRGYGLPEAMPWVSAAARLGSDRGRVEAAPVYTGCHAQLPLQGSRMSEDRLLPRVHHSASGILSRVLGTGLF